MTSNVLTTKSKIPILGLIGGIASGKSFVAGEFARQHCVVVDADRLGHEAMSSIEIQKTLRATFGDSILSNDGSIDRRKLAEIVFSNDASGQLNRSKLESILHPEIRRRAQQQIDNIRVSDSTNSKSAVSAIILDAPLLLEANWDSMCDYIVFVETADEVRSARAKLRGWSQQQWLAREATQLPIDEKRRAATHIVDGDQSPELLRLRVREILSELSANFRSK